MMSLYSTYSRSSPPLNEWRPLTHVTESLNCTTFDNVSVGLPPAVLMKSCPLNSNEGEPPVSGNPGRPVNPMSCMNCSACVANAYVDVTCCRENPPRASFTSFVPKTEFCV